MDRDYDSPPLPPGEEPGEYDSPPLPPEPAEGELVPAESQAIERLLAEDDEPIPGALEGETREQMLRRGKRAYRKLVPKRRRFVDEFLVDGNKTQAAFRAGYEHPRAQGHRLLTFVDVAAAVEYRKSLFAKFTTLDPAEVLRQFSRIAAADLRDLYDETGAPIPVHELPEDLAKVVQEVDGEGRARKLPARQPALDALAKFHGLYERDNAQLGEAAAQVHAERAADMSKLDVARRLLGLLREGEMEITRK